MEPQTTMRDWYLEGLYRTHGAYLVNRLTHMLRADRESARELVQQTFLALHEAYRANELGFPRAVLLKTATNFALMHIRHRRTAWALRPYVATEEISDDTPDRHVMADQIGQRLVAVIKDLRPNLRNVFVMAYLQDKPRKEIAAALGISEKRVEKRITQVLKTCRERLAVQGIDPP